MENDWKRTAREEVEKFSSKDLADYVSRIKKIITSVSTFEGSSAINDFSTRRAIWDKKIKTPAHLRKFSESERVRMITQERIYLSILDMPLGDTQIVKKINQVILYLKETNQLKSLIKENLEENFGKVSRKRKKEKLRPNEEFLSYDEIVELSNGIATVKKREIFKAGVQKIGEKLLSPLKA